MLTMTMKKCVHVHLRGGSRGRVEGFAHPLPPSDDLRLSNSTDILPKKKNWWFIGAEVKHETRLENLC